MAGIWDTPVATALPTPEAPRSIWDTPTAAPKVSATAIPEIWGGPPKKTKKEHDPSFMQRIEAGAQWAAETPAAHAADAVLNAPSRLTTGFIAGMGTPEGPFSRAARSFMDPAHATQTTHEAEANLHLPQPTNPWLRMPEDILVESLVDPTIMVPGWNAFSLANKAYKGSKLAGKVAEVVSNPEIEKAISYVSEPFASGRGFTREGVDLHKGEMMASESRAAREEQRYAALVEKHRPVLDAIDAKRAAIHAQMDAVDKQLADITGPGTHFIPGKTDALKAQRAALEAEHVAAYDDLPEEVRTAWDQRVYREGAPHVKRQAEAVGGYHPTPEEQAAAPLNLVNKYERNYEPEQRVPNPEEKDAEDQALSRYAGPIKAIRQGDRKATFDITKQGTLPTDPLADRMLNRFVKGARLEEYHRSRRNILAGMGLDRDLGPNMARASERALAGPQNRADKAELWKAAVETGNPDIITRAGQLFRQGYEPGFRPEDRYAKLLSKQSAAEETAAAKREAMIKPGTPEADQKLTFLDEQTARLRAARQAKLAGRDTMGIGPRTAVKDTRGLKGRLQGGIRGFADTERLAQLQAAAAAKTAQGAAGYAQQYGKNVAGAFGRVGKAAEKQTARTTKLGDLLENHQLVRAGLQSSLPGLRESTRELQKAYFTAKRMASGAYYKSGLGKEVDEALHEIAARRVETPAGTSLRTTGEGEATHVLGGQTTGGSAYTIGERLRIGSLVKKVTGGGKTPEYLAMTKEQKRILAMRVGENVLDEAMNAIGEARDRIDRIAESYDLVHPKIPETDATLVPKIAEMTAKFKAEIASVQKGLTKTPAVPTSIRRGIASVGKGQQGLQTTIQRASQVTPPSMRRVIQPSQRAAQMGQERTGKAADRLSGLEDRAAEDAARNEAIEANRKEAEALQAEMNKVRMPLPLQQKLFAQQNKLQKNFLAIFSHIQRKGLFIFPAAHMKNISVLTLLGPGGLQTIQRGIAHFATLLRTPEKLEQRVRGLEAIGSRQHFATEAEPFYGKMPVIGKNVGKGLDTMADWSAWVLESYDTAMRLALQETLESRGITGFKAGGQIRDTLGDYVNQSELAQELSRRWGANFPGWGLQIVPRAMFKALREQPKAFKTYARTMRTFDQDVTEPTMGTEFDAGGPPEDYFGLLSHLPAYASSPSRMGFPSLVFGAKDAMNRGEMAHLMEEQAARLVPGASAIGSFLHWPFPTAAPPLASGVAGTMGSYFPRGTKSVEDRKHRANELRSIGYSTKDANDILRSEGYMDAP
ncbi:MAG: hypothetical protein WCD38_11815 [Candidatus Tumulicola sp.]